MAKTDDEIHHECMQRFIELANGMREDGIAPRVVSAGMMTALAVYATYAAAGNDGRLAPSGVAKVAAAFQQQLDQVQQSKAAGRNKT